VDSVLMYDFVDVSKNLQHFKLQIFAIH